MPKNYKVIGVKKLKLSEFSVDGLKSLAKQANEGIRKEHKETVKKVLAKVKQQEKVDIKTAKKKLADDLQKKLIRVAKRRKADLIADITKNKKHIPSMKKASKQEAKVEKKPEKPPSPEPTQPPKQEYITRKVGGKIRRIPVSSLKKAEEIKAEKKTPKKVPKITVTEAEDDEPKEEPEIKAKLPPKSKQNLKLRIGPKKDVPKAAPKSDELKALKKQLKEKGVSKMVLKFIKTVEQAKEKLEDLAEEEEDDDDSKIIPQFLTMVSSKDRKQVEKLVLLVLPSKEYSKADQRDYLRDLKDMAEEWPNSAKPRIKYDEFPEAEKELFRILFPAIFTPKKNEEETKTKPKKKVTKSKKNVD